MTYPEPAQLHDHHGLDYALRRAEQESIAAIRAAHPIAAERHHAMAQAYSAMAVALLDEVNRCPATN